VHQLALTRWSPPSTPLPDEFPSSLARQVAGAHGRPVSQVEVGYRRYTTLKSTARIAADGRLVVTLSEDLRRERPEVQGAIAHVLAARVLSRTAPAWAQDAYSMWLRDPATRELSLVVRAARGRRRTLGPQGRHHDLRPLLDSVANELFDPPLAPPPVGWTKAAARAVLASFDEAHRVITVSRLLDHPRVRPETLRYLLYHEMLHCEDFSRERAPAAGPPPRSGSRRRLHPRSFRERLHRFPNWKAAEADLARAFRRRKVD